MQGTMLFYFASSKLLLPNGDIQKSPVVTSLLLLKVTYLGRKKLNRITMNRSLRHARPRGTATKITVMERVSFNYGPWVIHPINKAVSAERNRKTNYISYTFWFRNDNYHQQTQLSHHSYPCSTSIRRGTNLYTFLDDTDMASMGLWFLSIVL